MTSPTSGITVGLDAAGSGVGKGSASITNIPPAISNSIVDFAYSVGDRVVKSIRTTHHKVGLVGNHIR